MWCDVERVNSHASKQIKAGEVGAICRVDAASYFVVAWKGEPYMLQEEARGVECMLEAGTPVADAVLYHPVQHELGLYTPTTATFLWRSLSVVGVSGLGTMRTLESTVNLTAPPPEPPLGSVGEVSTTTFEPGSV